MPPNLSQARVALRERLDERVARQWSDQELDRWLYEGAKVMAREAEVLQGIATINYAAGTQEMVLPSDMVRIYQASWSNAGDPTAYTLEYRDFNNAVAVWGTQQAVTQGTPFLITMWGVSGGVKAILYPTPSQAGTLTVYYYKLPAVPEDGVSADPIDLPEGWEDVMYAFAEYRALRQDRDPRWQEAKGEFDEQMAKMVQMTRRYTDQQGQQVMGQYPAVNGWLYEFG